MERPRPNATRTGLLRRVARGRARGMDIVLDTGEKRVGRKAERMSMAVGTAEGRAGGGRGVGVEVEVGETVVGLFGDAWLP